MLAYPKTTLPPVCLEWPLFTQLMEGDGLPDTWHSSTTRAPTDTVSTWGHSFTDGGAAVKKGKATAVIIPVEEAPVGGAFLWCHTQHSHSCSSGSDKSLKLDVGGPAEVAPIVVLLYTAENTVKAHAGRRAKAIYYLLCQRNAICRILLCPQLLN